MPRLVSTPVPFSSVQSLPVPLDLMVFKLMHRPYMYICIYIDTDIYTDLYTDTCIYIRD